MNQLRSPVADWQPAGLKDQRRGTRRESMSAPRAFPLRHEDTILPLLGERKTPPPGVKSTGMGGGSPVIIPSVGLMAILSLSPRRSSMTDFVLIRHRQVGAVSEPAAAARRLP